MAIHLVTGGNGYLGSHLVRKLLDLGHEVRVVDLLDDPSRDTRSSFYCSDILDKEAMLNALKNVDVVHHNAALVPIRKAGKRFWEVNVTGTIRMLEAAKKSGVKHFSNMSSSAVFGNTTESVCPIAQTPPELHPIEIYGKSKAAGERVIFQHIKDNSAMTASIIRPRTIVGKGRLGIFSILFEWISENRNIYIIGDGSNNYQFAHVDDLVNASIKSASKRYSGELNIGTDRYGTLRDTLESLIKHAGSESNVVSLPVSLSIISLWTLDKLRLSPLGPWHYLSFHKPLHFDLELEKKVLDWTPKYSSEEILITSYDWYINNKNLFNNKFGDKKSAHQGSVNQGILKILKKLS